ncbi:unnamed protein product [Lactuca saligna]|uniref:Uncharacterized protein n=1 Tax=Lactuca saligna TaxID=75948 RepID=A0AA36E3L0_LACSI|nr:unnamed protein product [Lactuca saligna]
MEHEENARKMNAAVFESAEVCKSMTEKVNKLISKMINFMETYRTTYKHNTASANEALQNLVQCFRLRRSIWKRFALGCNKTLHRSKHLLLLRLQSFRMNRRWIRSALGCNKTLARKTENVKVLDTKLQQSDKRVHDLLSKKEAVRTCITDVTSLLSDIIETRDSMISITLHKHLAEKLNPVFAMLYRLQGVSPQSSK